MTVVQIGDWLIGPGQPCFVVAEIGINHNGDLANAMRLIDIAKVAGCSAVKFQKRTPHLCVPAELKDLQRETPWGIMSYLDYRHRVEFGFEEYDAINTYCQSIEMPWFTSCWDTEAVEFIEQFSPFCHKIASASLTDEALISKIAATGRPCIISTGMSTLEEVQRAIAVFDDKKIVVCQSTSSYPCRPEDVNLRVMDTYREIFQCPIGYSGHEVGLQITLAAVARGAAVVERHITIDRAMWGSDQAASLEPQGLMRLVRDIRIIEQALGDGAKKVQDCEMLAKEKLRKV